MEGGGELVFSVYDFYFFNVNFVGLIMIFVLEGMKFKVLEVLIYVVYCV